MKTAALFFDRVLPLDMQTLSIAFAPPDLAETFDGGYSISSNQLAQLIKGPSFRGVLSLSFGDSSTAANDQFMRLYDATESLAACTLNAVEGKADKRSAILGVLSGKESPEVLKQFLTVLNIRRASLFLPDANNFQTDEKAEDVLIKIATLPMANAESAALDQILEVRKDAEALRKLRRLRALVSLQYDGKSRQQIEDDLLKRLDDHAQAAKKHGFSLVTSTLSSVLDAKTLQASAGAALTAYLVGGPLAALPAALAIEVAGISLSIAKGRFEYRAAISSSEVAYLHDVVRPLRGDA